MAAILWLTHTCKLRAWWPTSEFVFTGTTLIVVSAALKGGREFPGVEKGRLAIDPLSGGKIIYWPRCTHSQVLARTHVTYLVTSSFHLNRAVWQLHYSQNSHHHSILYQTARLAVYQIQLQIKLQQCQTPRNSASASAATPIANLVATAKTTICSAPTPLRERTDTGEHHRRVDVAT